MSTTEANGCIEFSDPDDPQGPWMEVDVAGDCIRFEVTGRTYKDRDNYNTSDYVLMELDVDEAKALREFLSVKIRELEGEY